MGKFTKKSIVAISLGAIFAASLATVVSVIGLGTNHLLDASEQEYVLELNAENNKPTEEEISEGRLMARTALGNEISISLSGIGYSETGLFTISNGGYLANPYIAENESLNRIAGLKSIEVTFEGGNLAVYTGQEGNASGATVLEGTIQSGVKASLGDGPSYFKLENLGEVASVSNIEIVYSCRVNVTSDGQYEYAFTDGGIVITKCTSALREIVVPSTINGYKVVGIREAFYGNPSIKSVTIPEGVIFLGESAFYSCDSLESVNLPSTLKRIEGECFYGCKSLVSISLPSGLEYIGSSSFGWTGLNEIEIPSSVSTIEGSPFSSSSVKRAYCQVSVQPRGWSSGWSAGIQSVIWGYCESGFYNGLKYAVRNIDGMYSAAGIGYDDSVSGTVEIPSLASIGGSLYVVTSVLSYAFESCPVESMVISSAVTSIGSYAFYNCISLESIVIPSSVTSIGNYAFYGCTSLTIYCEAESRPSGWYANWNYDNRPVVWGYNGQSGTTEDGFAYGISEIGGTKSVTITGYSGSGGEITIPASFRVDGEEVPVASIGSSAFHNCTSLTSIVIPSSVTSIGDHAFNGCSSLTSVTFGEGSQLESIGSWAFQDCFSLTSIVIPSSVTSIGSWAFQDCFSLTSIVIPSSVTSIGSSAFYGCSSLTIYCEAESQPEGWSQYWNFSGGDVYWGGTWSYVNGIPTPNAQKA